MIAIVSWLALFISVISLSVSIFRIYRDRSKLIVWSEIVYHHSAKDNKEYPVMHLYAVNAGLRPITITDVGYTVSKNKSEWTPIKPVYDMPLNLSVSDTEFKLPQQLAHEIGIRLEDGDIYEMRIRHNDYDMFISTRFDGLAKKMFFKDILNNKHYIKNSSNDIKKLDQNTPSTTK